MARIGTSGFQNVLPCPAPPRDEPHFGSVCEAAERVEACRATCETKGVFPWGPLPPCDTMVQRGTSLSGSSPPSRPFRLAHLLSREICLAGEHS